VSGARLGDFALDDLEIASRFGNLRHFHWSYCESCCCHKSSCDISDTAVKHLRKLVLPPGRPQASALSQKFVEIISLMRTAFSEPRQGER
jgi:hypothetical protein